MAERILWGELTERDLEEARHEGYLVLVPVGAVEQHGPHLPTDTDISISYNVAIAAARQLGCTVVAPPVSWGYSAMQMGFASTITLRPTTLLSLLEDICSSVVANGFRKIALVTSHAGNRPIAQLFIREFKTRIGVTLASLHYTDFGREAFSEARTSGTGGEMHAGEFETSIELHLRPELVQMEHAEADYVDPKRHFGLSSATADIYKAGNVTVGYDIKDRFPSGVLGDPTVASAQTGKAIFDAVIDGVVEVLKEYRSFDYGDPEPRVASFGA